MAPLMVVSVSYAADTNAVASHDNNASGIMWLSMFMSVASHDKEKYIVPHFSCLDLRHAVVKLMMLLAWCFTDASASGIKWAKSHVASHFNCLDLRNAMVPFLISLPSCDANNSANNAPHFDYLDKANVVVPFIGTKTSHDADGNGMTLPKSHIASPFHHLELANGMVQLITLMALCDTDTSISGITWPKRLCWNSFDYIYQINALVSLMIPLASHDQKGHIASPFDHLGLPNGMVPLMTLLASCDTDTSISGLHDHKKDVALYYKQYVLLETTKADKCEKNVALGRAPTCTSCSPGECSSHLDHWLYMLLTVFRSPLRSLIGLLVPGTLIFNTAICSFLSTFASSVTRHLHLPMDYHHLS